MLLKKGRGKGRADLLLAVTALHLVVLQLNVVLGETWFPTVQLGGSDEMPVCPTSEMESGHGGWGGGGAGHHFQTPSLQPTFRPPQCWQAGVGSG